MDDLFQEFGIDMPVPQGNESDDLFKDINIQPPKASETNTKAFNQTLDIDKYKETSRLFDERLAELKAKKGEKSFTNLMADLSTDPKTGDVEWQWYNPVSWIGSTVAENRKYLDDQIKGLEANEKLIKSTMTPERFQEIKDLGAIGVYESFKKNLAWENIPFAGGFVEGYQKGHIADLMEKIRDGEEALTDAENETVKDYLNDVIETSIRGTSFGGKVVDGAMNMPAFMIEYGVAKGLLGKTGKIISSTSAGQKATAATSKIASAVSKTGKVGDVAVKTTKAVAKGGGRAMFMPQMTYNNYNDMRLNNVYSLGENGQILFNENPENKATMLFKAFGLSTISALSEDSGDTIVSLAKKGVSPIFNKMPVGIRNELIKLARKSEKFSNTPISKMFSQGGYSSFIGELGEEELERVLGAATGLNPQGDTYFDSMGNALLPGWEQFLVEAGVISFAGATRSGMNYLYNKGFSPKFVKNLSTKEQDALVEKEIQKDIAKQGQPRFETVEVPLDQIKLSSEIPNFKEGANENGVVAGEQLQGSYDRLGAAPIVLWERTNGDLEIITGRHRLDLAKRTGEATIPSQIVKEADGYTAARARIFDVEQNIKDEKGSIKDYARYFKETKNELTEEAAKQRGLLGRSKGGIAFKIARDSLNALYDLFINGKIPDAKAAAIADGAPNNEAAQAAGIKASAKMPADELRAYVSLLSTSEPTQSETGDMFGFDDSAVKEAEAIAKLVAKDKKDIDAKISAVRGALRNPEVAKEMGLKFSITPENIGKEVERLVFQKASLDKFATSPELMKYYRDKVKGKTGKIDTILAKESEAISFSQLPDEAKEEVKKATETEKKSNEDDKIEIDDSESWIENWNRHLFDTVAPLENISNKVSDSLKDGERPDLLARIYQYSRMMIEKNITSETFVIDENGNGVNTGEGFVPILKDFTSVMYMTEKDENKALDDLNDYLVAVRYTEDLDEIEGVEVSEEQKAESLASIVRLQEKYGENFSLFDDFANRIYKYQTRILHNLVDSGNLSEEQFSEITEKHKHYVPFKRVFEEKNITGGISSRLIFDEAKASRVIKKIKGSDRAVKNIFVSIEMNSANILDLAYRNKVARSVANMKGLLPQYIQDKKPLYEKGKTTLKIAFDKGLMDALEKGIKILGGNLERKKTLAGRNTGLRLASYSHNEKLVSERIGIMNARTHEFGHMLDYELGLGDYILNSETTPELLKLAEERLSYDTEIEIKDGEQRLVREAKPTKDSYLEYIKNRREVIANLYDSYINAPQLTEKIAPKSKKLLDEFIKNSEHKWLQDIKPTLDTGIEDVEKDAWIVSNQKPFGNVIEYYENGKKKYVEVAKPIFEAMHQLNPIQVGWLNNLFKIASVPAKIVRFGATSTPNFILRNFIKDQFTAFVQTDKGMKTTPYHTAKALFEIVGKGEVYNQWQKSGGSGSGYYDWSETGAKKFLQELNDKSGRFWKAAKWIATLQFIQKPSQIVEEATRLGAFSQAKKAGLSDIRAALQSREATVDFARGGDVSKLINRFVPFFNVGMQSANKLYRTAKEHPAAFLFNSLSTIAFPSIMITGYYLYGAPEEERKRWLEIPDYVRDNNWCFFKNGELITFPKPFTVGYMGTIFEDIMIWGYKGDKPEAREWYDLMLGAAGSLSPIQTAGSLLTPIGQVSVEATANYNFFQGRPIYPQWMDRLPPEERATKTNSQLSVAIGKAFNVSPAKVDNTMFGLTSTMGRQIVGGAENMLDSFKRWNGEEVPESVVVKKDIPLLGAIFGRLPDGTRSKSYQEFMKNYQELSHIKNAYAQKDGVEKSEYREKHHREFSKYKALDNFKDQISRIQKRVNSVYDDPHMSSDDKTKQIIELEKQITDIARNANSALKQINNDE